MMRNYAFTLSEVLITLAIIGVVAAMTLPVLLHDIQNRELQTGLKKAYSVLSQALDMYYAENGVRLTSKRSGSNADEVNWLGLKQVLMTYIRNIQDCGIGQGSTASTACIPNNNFVDEDLRKDSVYKTFNGKADCHMDYFDDGQFVINDGMLILLEHGSLTFISVDVNGYKKGPNRLGQDLFMFQLDTDGRLLPMGAEGTNFCNDDKYCSTTATDTLNGASCTYKALLEPDFFKNLP